MFDFPKRTKISDPQRLRVSHYAWCDLCGRDKDLIYDQRYFAKLCPYCDPSRSPHRRDIPEDLFLAQKILEALYHEITYVQRFEAKGFLEWEEQRNAVRLLRSTIPAHAPTQYSINGKSYQRPPVWPGMHERRKKEWWDAQGHLARLDRLEREAAEANLSTQWARRCRLEAKRKLREAKRARRAEAADRRERFLRLAKDVSS